MPSKQVFSQSSGIYRQLIIALSVLLVLFGAVFLSLIHIYSFPENSTVPVAGVALYLLSALFLVAYYILQWRTYNRNENELKNYPCLKDLKFVTIESISEKILRWTITIMALIFTIVSLIFVLICIYGYHKDSAPPHNERVFIGELVVVGTAVLIFIGWIRLSVIRRKIV